MELMVGCTEAFGDVYDVSRLSLHRDEPISESVASSLRIIHYTEDNIQPTTESTQSSLGAKRIKCGNAVGL